MFVIEVSGPMMCVRLSLLIVSGRYISLNNYLTKLSSFVPSMFTFIPETRTEDRLLNHKLFSACWSWSVRLHIVTSIWLTRCSFSLSVFSN